MSDPKPSIENAKTFVHNAFSLLSSGSTAAASTAPNASKSSEKSPEDIPKDELVHLCMKMNKRMQAMEAKGQELIKKKNSLLSDKKVLIDFLKSIPLHVHIQEDQDVNSEMLAEGWKQHLSHQHEYTNNLESKLAAAEYALTQMEVKHRQEMMMQASTISTISNVKASDDSSNPSDAASSSENDTRLQDEMKRLLCEKEVLETNIMDLQSKVRKHNLEIENKKVIENGLRSSVASLEETIKTKTSKIDELQKMLDSAKSQFEERILFLQMQQNTWKQREDVMSKEISEWKRQNESMALQLSALQLKLEEKEVVTKSGREISQALQSRLVEIESELSEKNKLFKEMEKKMMSLNEQIKDKDEIIANLRRDAKVAAEGLEDYSKRLKDLEEYRIKTEGLMIKLANQAEQINTLTTELEDKSSLITRLRSEAQANDRNHAMRTAMLATCEAQLEALNTEVASKNETIKEVTERVTLLQSRLGAAEDKYQERISQANSKIEELEKLLTQEREKHENEMNTSKSQYEENLENAKKEFSKKSNLARALISEKEEENRLLVTKIQELQSEIASGAPTERRIFELAQYQAKRENIQGQHSDTREIVFHKMQSTLAERDLEFARLQQLYSETSLEIAELKRIARRETVNMDYLKNIVLQYMTFPINAPERMSLIPVISTLLQFNPKEMVEVDKSAKDPNWSSRPVKEIKRSLSKASSYSAPRDILQSTHDVPSPRADGAGVVTPN